GLHPCLDPDRSQADERLCNDVRHFAPMLSPAPSRRQARQRWEPGPSFLVASALSERRASASALLPSAVRSFGQVKRIRVPRPSWGSTAISPPTVSTTRRATARPAPTVSSAP